MFYKAGLFQIIFNSFSTFCFWNSCKIPHILQTFLNCQIGVEFKEKNYLLSTLFKGRGRSCGQPRKKFWVPCRTATACFPIQILFFDFLNQNMHDPVSACIHIGIDGTSQIPSRRLKNSMEDTRHAASRCYYHSDVHIISDRACRGLLLRQRGRLKEPDFSPALFPYYRKSWWNSASPWSFVSMII